MLTIFSLMLHLFFWTIMYILRLHKVCAEATTVLPHAVTSFQLPPNYIKEKRPSLKAEPTIIYFDVHIQAINPIKAEDMDFRFDMIISQRWVDKRLNFSEEWFSDSDHILLPAELVDQIWHPDPFVVNAKSIDVGQLTQKLVSVNIYRNQTVVYYTNLFATVACAMNYKFYPYDYQLCPMYIESFSYDETKVKYWWANADAFTINPKLRMLQFQVTWPLHYEEASVPRYNEARNFSQLIAYFRFDRLLGNHLIQTFSPCFLVVSLSWFSFWLELNALSARMSLLVTSILTLVTQFAGLKTDLPPVAYIKAVDIWMAGCLASVFGALGEFVLVKIIYSLTEDVRYRYAVESRDNRGQQSMDKDKTTNTEDKATLPRQTETTQFHLHTFTVPDPVLLNKDINSSSATSRRRLGLLLNSGSVASSEENNAFPESSIDLHFTIGKIIIPLAWKDQKTGHEVVLWRKIDNSCKLIFPITYCIFCCVYWIVLYIHSRTNAVKPFTPPVHSLV